MKKVFVIIVTYKGHKWYERCFTSLRNSSYPVQTIVIDNASNDGTVEYIRNNFPEIHLIESKENLGFGKANNIGMRYALDNGCDYVFLLNQDTWIKEESIQILVSVAHDNPEYGILSPMHLKADEKSLYIQIEDGSTDHGNLLLSDCYFSNLKEVYPFTYINAAAWFISRQTLTTIGGFDPIFFLYAEDDNYLHRLFYHKQLLGLVPKSQIIHDHQVVNRDYTADFIKYRKRQYLLSTLVDVRKKININKILISYIKKWIVLLCTFNVMKSKDVYQDLMFIYKQKKKILMSRTVNVKVNQNWL